MMNPQEFERMIVNHSVKHSGHQHRRGYIGLSEMGACDLVIYNHYTQGYFEGGVNERLLNKISFELEAALITRLNEMGVYHAAPEISLHNGLVQGHPDGTIGEAMLEIKTVPIAEHFPDHGHLPRRVFMQLQAYMHFGEYKNAMLVYLARSNGALAVISVRYQEPIGREIETRLGLLVKAVQEQKPPKCSCRRCGKVTGMEEFL